MPKVEIATRLVKEITRKFKKVEAHKILDIMESLETSPKKGKALGHVDTCVIKELKYKKFRFYFITDGQILKFGTKDQLASLLIKFVRTSEKKNQEKVLREVKAVLRQIGF